MPDIVIKVEDLVKTYRIYDKPMDRLKETLSITKKIYSKEFKAIDGISFDVEKGDAIGILGKNGSGKSTLLKLITGVSNPTSGRVITNGKISSILELGTGFNSEYTGMQNIYLNGSIMGYKNEEMDKRVEKIVEFADIGDFINQPVKIYSSGMFARLAFAVVINVDPDILIIDEALAVGDTRFQVKCIDKLKSLKENGTTVLFVSHATEQVKRFCNKAIWLKDGKIEMMGESSEIADMYEDYMKFGEVVLNKNTMENISEEEEKQFKLPENRDIIASITNVEINKQNYSTFDEVYVDVTYEIYDEKIDGFLVGVAIYSPDRKDYIFGPNTYLDKFSIPNTLGRHKVRYTINGLTLLSGSYVIDAGIFNNEGMVMIDYKKSIKSFSVSNSYFSEGRFFINHKWRVLK